jgi:glycosyltransferase involved in cell wall biosynthesis
MKLSFVIPTFNSVTWAPHSIKTALDQTHKDIEVIVVNDASTDATREYLDWLEKFDSRVKVIHNKRNMGRSASRNIGNKAAQGDIIMVLDADDIATPNRAELTLRQFNKKAIDYLYGQATVIDALGMPHAILGADAFDLEASKKELTNKIVHSSAAYTKEFAEKFPYPDGEAARLGVDDFCQQIKGAISGARFDFVPHKLCCYRVLDSGVSQQRNKEEVLAFKRKYVDSLLAVAA